MLEMDEEKQIFQRFRVNSTSIRNNVEPIQIHEIALEYMGMQ